MSRSDEQRIADILEAAGELAVVVADGRESFAQDPIRRRAAERLREIIGEAASQLSEQTTARYQGVAWRDVGRLRIVLAHHYQRVDPDQVWMMASVEVPTLVEELSHR